MPPQRHGQRRRREGTAKSALARVRRNPPSTGRSRGVPWWGSRPLPLGGATRRPPMPSKGRVHVFDWSMLVIASLLSFSHRLVAVRK
eukprot:1193644-Prorocentrum_minimum.AAC.1